LGRERRRTCALPREWKESSGPAHRLTPPFKKNGGYDVQIRREVDNSPPRCKGQSGEKEKTLRKEVPDLREDRGMKARWLSTHFTVGRKYTVKVRKEIR